MKVRTRRITGYTSVLIHRSILTLCLILVLSRQARSEPPSLGLPVRCIPGSNCFIQNYFDHDPGPGYHDYACGHLSYDGHIGTDFRLRDYEAMRTKVAVLAAAPGVVVGTRNGEPDISVKKRGNPALGGKDAGNGVKIDHGDGWATQYSHMLQGSVQVHPGDRVEKGDLLGFVGLSGNTEFPHLDFSVSKDRTPVDPFNPARTACGTGPATLWSASVLPALRYQATGLLISGFSSDTPDREIAEDGGYRLTSFPADADRIVYWIELFGVRKNDLLSVVWHDPRQRLVVNHEKVLSGNKAVQFSYVGKKRKSAPWLKGTYSSLFRLVRDGKTVIEDRREFMVH